MQNRPNAIYDSPMTRAEFISEIETFIAKRKMTKTQFGRDCMNDPSFVFRLDDGRDPKMETVATVMAYMAKQRGKR